MHMLLCCFQLLSASGDISNELLLPGLHRSRKCCRTSYMIINIVIIRLNVQKPQTSPLILCNCLFQLQPCWFLLIKFISKNRSGIFIFKSLGNFLKQHNTVVHHRNQTSEHRWSCRLYYLESHGTGESAEVPDGGIGHGEVACWDYSLTTLVTNKLSACREKEVYW